MKGRKNVGEYKFLKRIKNCTIKQFGRKEFVNLKKPDEKDKILAQAGAEFLAYVLKQKKKPDLLILDEINLACKIGLINTNEIVEKLKKAPKQMQIILTGRHAPRALKKIADLITEMKDVKHPKKTIKGIHF